MKDFWNQRYNDALFAYGEKPNDFFAHELNKMAKGTLILPCEGEGRNAAFASKTGWKVKAFDYSEVAKQKAITLAAKMDVKFEYTVEDVLKADFPSKSADVVALIYAHFTEANRSKIHQKAVEWLKPGGKIILEAFNPKQLQNNSGGPKEITMLYKKDMLQRDFYNLNIELLDYFTVELKEGKFHNGRADVVRLIATKIT